MTIHMKALGITVAETAIIYGIYPIFAIFAPFSMGIIADKLGNFKVTHRVFFKLFTRGLPVFFGGIQKLF